jgi:FixJ family two-component response regulator
MMKDPIVYIVDDDPDMRESLHWLMKTVGLHVATYASAADFLRDFVPGGPGCLVVDVRMPGTSGLDLFEDLTARGLSVPVIFITAYADVPMAIRAMKSGAVEFVEKPFNRQTLLEKVQRAIKDDVERRRLIADREATRARFRRLTEKERTVLDLIKAGRPNKAIATYLDITPRAVELRRASLMKKLGVRSLVELLRLTIAHEVDSGSPGNGR